MDKDQLIRIELAKLPTLCHDGYHDWVVGYGDPDIKFLAENKRFKDGEQMLPYLICRYCSARKEN